MSEHDIDPATPGLLLVRVAVATTVVFGVVQVLADVRPQGAVLAAAVFVSLGLFFAGSVAFLVGFVLAAGRSRDEQVTMAGLVWLTGSAPPFPTRVLRGVLVTQVVLALVTASVRPFTAVAFGILAPMAGLGLLVLWSARHGAFVRIGSPVAASPSTALPGPSTREPDDDPDDFDQLFRRRGRRGR